MTGTKKRILFFVLFFFIIFTAFLFRPYITRGLVPFPGNLLLAFYQPWASYTWDGYPHGPPAKPIGFDALRMFYPLRSVTQAIWNASTVPLWNPYSFAGNPLLGAYQSAVFFPLGFLFFLLPQIHAWSLIVFLAPILIAIGTYAFLRALKLGVIPSVFGAFTFAYCGMMIVWWEEMFMSVYSLLPLPYVLLAIHNLSERPAKRWAVLLVAGLVWSVLSGYFQTTFYLILISSCWALYLYFTSPDRQPKRIMTIAAFCITALLITAVQIAPGIEAYQYSARGTTDVQDMFHTFFIPLRHLITFLAPDYFGNPANQNYFGTAFYHEKVIWIGIPALILCLYGAWVARKKRIARFFGVFGLVSLSLAFSLPTSWLILYQMHLPFLSEMTPSRIVFLSSFCFAVLSSFGVEYFLTKSIAKKWLLGMLMLLAAALIAGWIPALMRAQGHKLNDQVSMRNMVIPTALYGLSVVGILLGVLWHKRKKLSISILFCISLVSVALFAQKYLYFSKPNYTFPDTGVTLALKKNAGLNRTWGVGVGYMERNFANELGLYSPEGYESFNIRRYNELLYSSHTQGKFTPVPNRADVLLYPTKTLTELSTNPYTLRLLSLLSVRYIMAPHTDESTVAKSMGMSRAYADSAFDVWEYPAAFPRAYIATTVNVLHEPQQILDALYSPAFGTSMAVIEETPVHAIDPAATGSAQIRSYGANSITVDTNTSGTTFLVLTDSYFPGWHAAIDNTETHIYRTNYALRGIIVPQGAHRVTFRYTPTSFRIGVLVTAAGALLFSLMLICFRLFV
jgi:hypothetical protein